MSISIAMQILSGVILGFQYYFKAYSKVNECTVCHN